MLNPTGGVKVKQPLGGLVFRKDPTRPGGGVFIARVTNEDVDKHLPQGTIIKEGTEGEAYAPSLQSVQTSDHAAHHWSLASSGQQQHHQHQQGMVSYAPLGAGNYPNVNPAMNPAMNPGQVLPPGHVQVMNLLDQPSSGSTLQQLAMADAGFLEGMPSSMFDWGTWL